MKRLAIAAAAALAFAAPLAIASTAAAHDRGDRYERDGRDHDRGYDRGDRDYDNRDDRRDERRSYRQGYRGGQWDARRHNGYTYRDRWYYGPPPSSYYGRRDFDLGYRAWRRGDRLPSYYRDHCRPVDWRYARLRRPPRGYHYVEDDRGDVLLVGITTGIILGIIAAGG